MSRASSSFLLRLLRLKALPSNLSSSPHRSFISSTIPRLLPPIPLTGSRCLPRRFLQTLPSPQPESEPGFTDLSSAPTADGVLAAFEALEPSLGDRDEGLVASACFKAAERLDSLGTQHLDKALALAIRALKFFEAHGDGASLSIARVLRLLGSISCKMRRYEESLDSLTTANEIISKLRQGSPHSSNEEILEVYTAIQLQLAATKNAMGQKRDALVNLRKSLELKESVLDSGCLELGSAYKDLAEAYTVVLDFNEAMPFCLKALEIYEDEFGQGSSEVVSIRRLLGVIYAGLGENEEASEQIELCRIVLESLGLLDELAEVETDAANIYIAMGKLEEAKNILRKASQRTEKESLVRALVLVSMGNVLCAQEKFGDARRCLQISCSILDKKEVDCPSKVVGAYADIALIYETMNDFEISLSLMKRTLAILQGLPNEQHLEGSISARIGWLLVLSQRVSQGLPYLELAATKLKTCYGPKNFGLGFVYKHIGQAYMDMKQPETAIKMFELAKDIIDESFGLQHEDSIDTYQCLANAYGTMGSYELATEYQQKVLKAWEKHGPSAEDEVLEAHRLLWQIKRKAEGATHAVFPANSLPAVIKRSDKYRTTND